MNDPDDPRLEVFQGLRDHVLRQRRERPDGDMAGVFVSEGDLVVERALAAGYELSSILVDGKRSKPMPDAIGPDVPIYAAGPDVLVRITGYHLHRGMLAVFHRRAVPEPEEILSSARTVVICENTNNPTNLGVILRCAAGLGVDGFLLDPTCSDPLYRRCGRVSMGEAYSLPYARLPGFPDGLDIVRDHGFRMLALTPAADALPLPELVLDADEPVAILLGAEGPGLTSGVLERIEKAHALGGGVSDGTAVHHGSSRAGGLEGDEIVGPEGDEVGNHRSIARPDYRISIPMSGSVDSINVGSASAVAFYGVQQARRG